LLLRISLLNILLMLCILTGKAQKVGVVLSGGGSPAFAHIGVLKALEENNIPIDYITGTSMGALIGALYASGYSPQEIEDYVLSPQFANVAYSETKEDLNFFFKQRDLNPIFLSIKITPNKPLRNSLPTHVYDSKYFDFELMSIFAGAEMVSDYNFDSLFVPFRCVASDIYNKKSVIFDSGNINQAVRASMTYPFYFYPLEFDSTLFFDGGLYNNFPKDIMEEEFNPGIIIGSNVSSNAKKPKADDLFSQLENMLTEKSEYTIDPEKGIVINLDVDINTFDFSDAEIAIAYGYQKTIEALDKIEYCVKRQENRDSLDLKRAAFNQRKKPLDFTSFVKVSGISKTQTKYVETIFDTHRKKTNLAFTKRKYFKIYSDDKISFIFPTAIYNPFLKRYELNIDVTKEKDLEISLGGILSTSPINTAFLELKYNILERTSWALKANIYFGKLYQSGRISAALDVPLKVPFFWEPFVAVNKFDYFKNSTTVFDEIQPPFIITSEFYIGNSVGFPFIFNSLIALDYKYFDKKYQYYTNPDFELKDTSDVTKFLGNTIGFSIEKFNQNFRQYATTGTHFNFSARFIEGNENSEYTIKKGIKKTSIGKHNWVNFNLLYNFYPVNTKYYSFGLSFQGNASNMPDFGNYFGTLISMPQFSPVPETNTLFLVNFRSNTWVTFGVMNVIKPIKIIQLRIEGYFFQPAFQIFPGSEGQVNEAPLFENTYYILSGAVVYQTRIGPLSFNFNYYSNSFPNTTFSLNFGYTLFNKSAWN